MNQIESSSQKPLVSVYIPTKNRQNLLKIAIKSVLEQTYKNIEILVVDDGSTDDTQALLTCLCKQHCNITMFKNLSSLGACASRNIAIKNAKGEFITGLDDDDVFLPNRIESLINSYDDKYAFLCSSMIWDYGKKNRLIDSTEGEITLNKQLSYNEATSQVFVKKSRLFLVGGFDEKFVSCQDYDLWTRLMIKFGSAYRIAVPTYIINDSGSSERMINNVDSVKGYHQYLEKHQHLMNTVNIKNQKFMKIRRTRRVLTFNELCAQIGTGYMLSKLRYFLSSNFVIIKKLHSKYYK